jgi:hypothetical protein
VKYCGADEEITRGSKTKREVGETAGRRQQVEKYRYYRNPEYLESLFTYFSYRQDTFVKNSDGKKIEQKNIYYITTKDWPHV